jgi:hypothetical protein
MNGLSLNLIGLHIVVAQIPSSIENRDNEVLYISEANSARSERFNTLPKRPTVDQFKYRLAFLQMNNCFLILRVS